MNDNGAIRAWRSRAEGEFRGLEVLADQERVTWMQQAMASRLRLFDLPIDEADTDIRGWVATTRLDDLWFVLEFDHTHRMHFSVAFCCPNCEFIGIPHQLKSQMELGRALYAFKTPSHVCSDSKSRPAPIRVLSDVGVQRAGSSSHDQTADNGRRTRRGRDSG